MEPYKQAQISRDDNRLAELDVLAPESPLAREVSEQNLSILPSSGVMVPKAESNIWSSPTFMKGTVPGGLEIFSSGFDPFAEEDVIGLGGPRKRPKFGRESGEWRYISKESPTRGAVESRSPNLNGGADADVAMNGPLTKSRHDSPEPASRMAPPTLPAVRTDGTSQNVIADSQETPQPATPRSPKLSPVKSPALPLVSPFPGHASYSTGSVFWDEESGKNNNETFAALDSQPGGLVDGLASNDARIQEHGLNGSQFSRPQIQSGIHPQENEAQQDLSGIDETNNHTNDDSVNGFEKSSASQLRLTDIVDLNMTEEGDEPNLPSSTQETSKLGNMVVTEPEDEAIKTHPLSKNESTELPQSSQITAYGGEPSREQTPPKSDLENFSKPVLTSPNFTPSQELRKSIQSQVESSLFGFPPPVKPSVPDTQTQASTISASCENQLENDNTQDHDERVDQSAASEQSPKRARYETQADITPETSQDRTEGRQFSITFHRVDQILDRGLPMTPAPTQSNLEDLTSGLDQRVSSPQSKHTTQPKPKSPRTHVKPQYSEVPDVISPWFRSRRSSRLHAKQAHKEDTHKEQGDTKKRHASQVTNRFQNGVLDGDNVHEAMNLGTKVSTDEVLEKLNRDAELGSVSNRHQPLSAEGFRTSLSYYAPLSALETYLTASSTEGAMEIDLFGVVTLPSSKPTRAKSGPKDFHNVMHIADLSSYPHTAQVQCFRPFREALPTVEVGDVLVLRNFVVKSRKRDCFLLSTHSSAWLTWRFSKFDNGKPQNVEEQNALSAQHALHMKETKLDIPEECPGPLVEVGTEEREHAFALRSWWTTQVKSQN